MKAGRLAKGLVAKTLADSIVAMANNFIAGADATAACPSSVACGSKEPPSVLTCWARPV